MSGEDKKGFFTKEEQDDIMRTEEPKDPQYNGEAVVNDEEKIQESVEGQQKGLFGFFKKTEDEEENNEGEEEKTEDEEENNEGEEEKTEDEEEKTENKGLLASLFGKKEEVDCELLLKQMRECVKEKDGTTMCKLEVDEWEKHCKNDENKEDTTSDDDKSDDE